jgi:hypothetical protein
VGAGMILCNICTRGRYDTTLPLAIQAVVNQTKQIDKLIIYDDNDEPKDLRENQIYKHLFESLNYKGIQWEWVYALRKGQHYSHQMANESGYEFVWRVDDDCRPEQNVLENLLSHMTPTVGAVGGSILTPPYAPVTNATGRIEDIYTEPNLQWDMIKEVKSVDHLHCSFLYRAGIHDYNLNLSRVAHREETLFTYGLKQLGYDVLVVPDAVTWHMKYNNGGIRSDNRELFEYDEKIFRNTIGFKDQTVVVLDNGIGDHIVFKHVLPLLKNPVVFSCYPEVIPGRSIQEARDMFGSLDQWNIYRLMDKWDWTDSLENAFRKMYKV